MRVLTFVLLLMAASFAVSMEANVPMKSLRGRYFKAQTFLISMERAVEYVT